MRKDNFIPGILMMVAGLFLIIKPERCVKVFIIVLGIEAVINGIFNLVTMRSLATDESFRLAILIRGVVSIAVGVLSIFLPLAFAGVMWIIMMYVFALYLLTASVLELFAVAQIRDTGINRKQFIMEAVVSIIIAVILFIIPAQIGSTVLRILGVLTLVSGAAYLFVVWKNRSLTKNNTIIEENAVVADDDGK
jgi:uncharacterized membrane protein HdeD (DUF308 family)